MPPLTWAAVGAALPMWLLAAVIRRTLFRRASGWRRALGPAAVAFVVGALVAAAGLADGGPLRVAAGLTLVALPAALVAAVDALRFRFRSTHLP